jgi:HSP20 family protein
MLNTLLANDVRQTLDQFRRSVDEMFENFQEYRGQAAQSGDRPANWTFSPLLESSWTDTALHLRAIIPGVPEKDVQVSVQNNQLIVEGERKHPEGFRKNAFRQMAYGKFYTAVALPTGLDVDKVQCQLHDGVLDIYLPLSEASRPRQIQINAAQDTKSIGA